MLGDLSHVEKIYIRTGYTDMRKQLNGLVDIIQYNFKLGPSQQYIVPVLRKTAQTGSKQSTMKVTDSVFCTSVLRTGAFNGPGPVKKPGRYPSSSSAGCWKD